ncbi:hypothetical protein PFICI_11449 [Pestalotiopsis fici W106-1]|uniref:Tc1-like transposase DDE domain-containing protein n=1 Tax=Pestalotiopsis fici (strain W106-1 / CGMCC3.15140) TaxID=1229662 RepID=W3WUQ7_PESFW|nr:uncharacterized protein PFICI_11449 [Pestalotiopsis fici W106-1]ETS77575.1 hypothetical protein PFICI_11449 [Pestalotiopsis fici W106-1]
MFWAGILYGNRTALVAVPGDPESKKGGASARVYKSILEEHLPTIMDASTVFMHDNAPIHTAHSIVDWLEEMAFTVLDWPPYSPDLNPIENLWFCLKERICKKDPELSTLSANFESKERLITVAEDIWEDIEQDLINRVILSMPRRINAIINARGWYTRY